MYGGAEGNQVCSYDKAGIDRTSDGNLRIWSVCHVSEDLENFAGKNNELIENAANKIAKNEYPPYALMERGFTLRARAIPSLGIPIPAKNNML
jgi:hypothetical protein